MMKSLRLTGYIHLCRKLMKPNSVASRAVENHDFISWRSVSSNTQSTQKANKPSNNVGIDSFTEQRDLYEILDITPDATTTEVREAFFRKAKVYHPDVDPSAKAREEFLKSKEAYQILSDVLERHEYDKLILGSNRSGNLRTDSTSEEQETKILEKVKEDQEVYLSTRQDFRKQTYVKAVRWKDEYEWVLTALGGRNYRKLKHLRNNKDQTKTNFTTSNNDPRPKIVQYFSEKYAYNHSAVPLQEGVRRQKVIFLTLLILYIAAMLSRMIV